MKNFKSVAKNIKEEMFGFYDLDGIGHSLAVANDSHSAALEMGFELDVENDVYVLADFGAFVHNVSSNITSMQDIYEAYDEVLKCNPLHKIVELQKQGYEFDFGPSFPLRNGKRSEHFVGLYCTNYEDMVQKENEYLQSL